MKVELGGAEAKEIGCVSVQGLGAATHLREEYGGTWVTRGTTCRAEQGKTSDAKGRAIERVSRSDPRVVSAEQGKLGAELPSHLPFCSLP